MCVCIYIIVVLLLKKRVEMREIRMCVVFLPANEKKNLSIFCLAATWKKNERKDERKERSFPEKSLQFYYSH